MILRTNLVAQTRFETNFVFDIYFHCKNRFQLLDILQLRTVLLKSFLILFKLQFSSTFYHKIYASGNSNNDTNFIFI